MQFEMELQQWSIQEKKVVLSIAALLRYILEQKN